jgi:hypothetical protein
LVFRLPPFAFPPDFLAVARLAGERFAVRFAADAVRVVFLPPLFFAALFLPPPTAFLAVRVATFTWRCTRFTVRRTTRRAALRGSAVLSIALVAAVPAAVAAELAASAADCAVSTTARVALPSVLPTFSAA